MATEKVYEVKTVKLTVEKSTLIIHADGVARTPGYTNPRLEPHIYIQPPPDGIWGFDFVADKPEGQVQQVLSPISTKYEWKEFPKDLKGVKVHAETNSVEEKLEATYSTSKSY